MSFEIQRREVEGILILAPQGRLVAGEPLTAFRSAIEEAQAGGRPHAVLDFTDVDYIDSSGLGCLVTSYSRFQKSGGKLPIFGLNDRGLELMVITKLSTVFEIYDNEMDAVNSCFPSRTAKSFDVLDFVRQQRASREAKRREG